MSPTFRKHIPYPHAIAELQERSRLTNNTVGRPALARLDTALKAAYDDVTPTPAG